MNLQISTMETATTGLHSGGGKSLNLHWTEFIYVSIEKNSFVLLSVIYNLLYLQLYQLIVD